MPEIEVTIIRVQYIDAPHAHINIYYGDGSIDQDVMYPSGVPAQDQPIDDFITAGGVARSYPGTVQDVRYRNRQHTRAAIQYSLIGWIERNYPTHDPFIDDAVSAWVGAGNTIAPFLGAIVDIRYVDVHESAVEIEYDNGNIERDVAYPGDLDAEIDGWVAGGNTIKPFYSDADRLSRAKKVKIESIWRAAFDRIEKVEAGMNPDNPNTDPIRAKKRALKKEWYVVYWISRAVQSGNILSWRTQNDIDIAAQYVSVAAWVRSTLQEAESREDDVEAATDLAGVNAVTPSWPGLT